jgi:hypothetical protein
MIASVVVLVPGVLGLVVALPHLRGAGTNTTVLNPIADSYVSQTNPDAVHGREPLLHTGGPGQAWAFLGFNVTGTSNSIVKATLRIHARDASSAGFRVEGWGDGDWSESGLTWTYVAAEPLSTLGPVVGASGPFHKEAWVSVDVTSLVKDDGYYSLVLVPNDAQEVTYDSREGSKDPPQLLVEARVDTDLVADNTRDASASPTQRAIAVPTPTSDDPVIAAAGDIACDPASTQFNGGKGIGQYCRQEATSDILLAIPNLKAVLALGDTQYYCGGYTAFARSYDTSWGKLKSITHPVIGNHEYLTSGGTDCDQSNLNGAGYFKYFGSAAGDPRKGYYAYNIGTWRLYALNSNCKEAGGCNAESKQGEWLAADLAQHPNKCVLAYWHIPFWSSGGRASPNTRHLVRILYRANADVILTGHDHLYERFAPQNPDSQADPDRGLRAFVVGTGGANHTGIDELMANSEVINTDTYGVLHMVLHPDGYDWTFIPAAFDGNGSFTDSGSGKCH